ncbi:hypothetical protein PR202_ga05716 [Eleusine coracana subsp. coracana]|uniref:non-specific serine/threonine protein kinase n=1 Tax=Eleusine coracana subsp. coracana TaxID=191504 RepID=A0AAV5BUW6_ELECO|nr:hypothetical protein PR202_ga05716 [Eleusine coracana subsp. coracana]
MAPPQLLLLFLATATAIVLRVTGQGTLDSTGFISIDCGLPENSSYVDVATNLLYVSDAGFTETGINRNISAEYIQPNFAKRYLNVRSFPDAARSCYTLGSLSPGSKYLLRATFMYGNYDGLNKPPSFDLYLGVNFWTTVSIIIPDLSVLVEVIAVVPDDFVQICLVNTGSGTPFISGLDLRPLRSTLYEQVNATQGLVLLHRNNLGPTDNSGLVRYPDDPYDRAWNPWLNMEVWSEISTDKEVQGIPNVHLEVPSKVMQTAITPRDGSMSIDLPWDAEPNHVYPMPGYICIMYVAELQNLVGSSSVRQFYVTINGKSSLPYTPKYLVSDALQNLQPHHGFMEYNASINATANSTLPPIINAIEVFSVISTANVGTDAQDVSAITAIKAKYQVKKNWMGDPCIPKTLVWDGLNCSYAIPDPSRITAINLSASGLSGDISLYFSKLATIEYLDLSHNKLTGTIPDVLSQLSSLKVLYSANPNLCSNGNICQSTKKTRDSMLAVYIAVPIVVFLVAGTVVLFLFVVRRKKVKSNVKRQNGVGHNQMQLENRQFTYRELEVITNSFQRVLGRGGFGYVYDGILEDGTQVAVKLQSTSSSQGVREFLTEVKTLTKIHHKNLVSLIGYCKDGNHLALVYEHMSQGSLEQKLRGKDQNAGSLTWRQRLNIALESAQGLEYLHKACSPPFVHRDIKTANILLTANLEAKIADFGLLKAFKRDDDTHVSTARLVGTHGYVAPEYATALHLTEKSDVYSFGVVLLELITGQPPILHDPQPINVIQWTEQCLAQGEIKDVVDKRMRGDYNANVAWKVMDVALKCTAHEPTRRPTMTDVVARLQECLRIEEEQD